MSTRRRERGFALLIVLFAVGLLSLLTSRLIADGRGALAVAGDLRDAAAAEAAADGAVQQAIFQLRRNAWAADGSPHPVVIGRAAAAVTALDERGRINPNRASITLLAALLANAGVPPAQASDLAGALVDWRTATPFSVLGGQKLDRYLRARLPYGPADRPFTSVDELAQVPGMPLPLLAHLRGVLSVYQSIPPAAADNEVSAALQAVEMIGRTQPPAGVERIIELRAIAVMPGGVTARRRVLVRLGSPQGTGKEWQILTWGR